MDGVTALMGRGMEGMMDWDSFFKHMSDAGCLVGSKNGNFTIQIKSKHSDDVIWAGQYNCSSRNKVLIDEDNFIEFMSEDDSGDKTDCVFFNREEAIEAARAILKHFDVDYDVSGRYRPLTSPELAKFLAENPHYKLIPKEAYDPDAPLTSELSRHFGEE